ncbi:hypothetical protein GLYMA_05G217051v4 [Glycine max]|nr:hypothetical protein GLYMA_05G217051v4 [Glycine max]KAG4391602.1 hypothetical protein GLYMA_05G217051v4 [Glycine max]KAG4391603.1 hypothetical protein GLYMA_05G217051v4 [Glycine max]KAG4391604.1 hypothetical protein GLYMA_05G217051v4 [Glycine max]KAG4391606.1 hypothetical protein GLYMA_05G217051v4 [Glycine max]
MRSHFLLWSFVEICETIFLLIILDICFWMKHRIVSCAKCRCQYELVLGDIVSIESEEIRITSCRTQHGHHRMGKGVKIREIDEAKHSCCCSLYCGADPFWSDSHS